MQPSVNVSGVSGLSRSASWRLLRTETPAETLGYRRLMWVLVRWPSLLSRTILIQRPDLDGMLGSCYDGRLLCRFVLMSVAGTHASPVPSKTRGNILAMLKTTTALLTEARGDALSPRDRYPACKNRVFVRVTELWSDARHASAVSNFRAGPGSFSAPHDRSSSTTRGIASRCLRLQPQVRLREASEASL